jgi:hypothetical protein
MRVWLVIGAGAVLLAAALAIEAPATLLDRRVAELTDGRVHVGAATGTLWRGSGEVTLLPDGVRIPIAWHLEATSLLHGGLTGSLVAADANRPATFSVGPENFSVRDFAITLPAAAVLRTAGLPGGLTDAGGTLALDVTNLARSGDQLEARADVDWKDAALPTSMTGTRIALGEVRITVGGSGAEIPATLSNAGGEVDIAGTLVFSTRGTPKIDARIKPRSGLPPERAKAITAVLSGIGRGDGAGAYRIAWPLAVR